MHGLDWLVWLADPYQFAAHGGVGRGRHARLWIGVRRVLGLHFYIGHIL